MNSDNKTHEFVAVGFRFRNSKASDLLNAHDIQLQTEADNEHDPNAIKVLVRSPAEDKHVGYITRDDNKRIAEVINTNNRYRIEVLDTYKHSASL